MKHNRSDFIIRPGLDDEDFFLLWPVSEWLIAVMVLGCLVTLHHVMLGFASLFLTLFAAMKLRSEQRGGKAHVLWRWGFDQATPELSFAPPAHVTRLDS